MFVKNINDIIKKYIPPGSLKFRYTRGAFWSLMSLVAAQGSSLITAILIARILGKENFGVIGILISTLGTLGTFAGVGLGTTVTKYIAEYRKTYPERAGRIIGFTLVAGYAMGIIVSLVLFCFSEPLASSLFNSPGLAPYLRIACGVLLFNTINGIQLGALSGFEDFKSIAMLNLFVNGILSFVLTVLGAYLWGLSGTIWGMVIVAMAMAIASRYVLRRKCKQSNIKIDYSGIKSELSILYGFSIPSFLSGIVVSSATWLGGIMLVNQSNGYAEMGVFNAANQWRSAVLFIPGILSQVSIPLLCNLYGEKRIGEYKRLVSVNLSAIFVLSSIIALPLILFSKPIMSFYGSGYSEKYTVLVIVALTTVLSSLGSAISPILISLGKLWQGFFINVIWALCFITLSSIQVQEGSVGLATSYFWSYMLHIFILTIYLIYSFFGKKAYAN
jgi:O-antigen/teichoic acid export membrane protein